MPLAGQRIVVTRAKEQSGPLSDRLRQLGAEVVELPVIAFAPPEDLAPLNSAMTRIADYEWAVFTSVNGVKWFFQLAGGRPEGWRARVCAVGTATAAALQDYGLEAELVPDEFVAEGVVGLLAQTELQGKRVLLPRAAIARDVIPRELARLGAEVDDVPVYRNVVPAELGEAAAALFSGTGRPDWVTLTSSSTVKNLLAAAGPERLAGIRFASIGPVTSGVAARHSLPVAVEAEPHTIDGLIDAIVRACS
jgi:uroporphyrinogen III methyltransferase/synthase